MVSPIILFAFNRLEAVRRTVESLLMNTEAADSELFVFVDGPRDHVPTDRDKVGAVQEYVKTIQGFKQVTCTFAEKNKGLGASVIAGVTQVIKLYGRAIVVEDDLYCGKNFLAYMNQGLERYAENKEVFSVCGYTNRVKRPEGYSYDAYACVRSSSWGWGTWSDRWDSVDWTLDNWNECEAHAKDFNRWGGSDCYGMLRKWHEGKNQSWAIRFCYSQFVQGKVAIFPMVSKVINEGFNNQGTNCHGWSRFKSDFDASDNKVFQWPDEMIIHPRLLHEALSYHTIWERLYSRVVNLFYRSSTDNQRSLNVNDSVIEPRMRSLDNCQSADIELADTNLNRSTLISVVIPLYNKEASIATALDSVLAQTYQDFEVVVVDDGSTDDGAVIVEQYADPRIRLVRQENAGVSAARNKGIAEAKGEYVAFLDADDEWLPGFLEEIVALQQEFPECRAQATSYLINSRGEKSTIELHKIPFKGRHGILTNYFEVAYYSQPPICSICICVERTLLQEIGGFPMDVMIGEDLLTWARIAVHTRWAYSLKPLAQYNFDQVSIKDASTRVPEALDIVGAEIKGLWRNYPHIRGLRQYISLWHKMRSSMYMRLGYKKECAQEAMLSLRYNPMNYKVYAYLVLNLLGVYKRELPLLQNEKKKLLIFHPTIAPYRIDFFNDLYQAFETRVCLEYWNLRDQTFDYDKIYAQFAFKPYYLKELLRLGGRSVWRGIWKHLNEFNPDVVLVSEYGITALMVLLYRLLKRKNYKIISICDDSYDMLAEKKEFSILHRIARRTVVPGLDDLVLVEPKAAEWYQQRYGKGFCFPIIKQEDKARAEYARALELSKQLRQEYALERKKVFLFVGRLVDIKNVDTAIKAFSRLDQDKNVFVIVGDGSEKNRWEQLAHELNTNVIFTGRKEGADLNAWYNVADIFVLPSYQEPFGAVTNEALLAGCFALVSNKAGSSCLIEEGVNGFTFSPMDVDVLSSLMEETTQLQVEYADIGIKKNRMLVSYDIHIDGLIKKLGSI